MRLTASVPEIIVHLLTEIANATSLCILSSPSDNNSWKTIQLKVLQFKLICRNVS